jgi:uncharacterized membrane protein
MNTLLLGIVIFLGAHLFTLLAKPARARLASRLGEGPYKGAFALVSLVGLALMIWGLVITRSGAEPVAQLYEPPTWGRHAAMLLVLLGFLSLAISFHKGRLKLWLKHPMSIGFGLWAIGHLLANGALSEVLFFGTFLALAALDIGLSTARGKEPHFMPKPRHDFTSIAAGVLLFLIFLWLHPYLIGVAVV